MQCTLMFILFRSCLQLCIDFKVNVLGGFLCVLLAAVDLIERRWQAFCCCEFWIYDEFANKITHKLKQKLKRQTDEIIWQNNAMWFRIRINEGKKQHKLRKNNRNLSKNYNKIRRGKKYNANRGKITTQKWCIW